MPTEQCYGVIVVYKDIENLFLILQQKDKDGSWTFPKGHHEGTETAKQTALRELLEETQIKDIEFIDAPLIHEEYIITHTGQTEKVLKVNEYYIGFVKNKEVTIQKSEINTYKWATYTEALETLQYIARKETLKKAQEYLTAYESGK